MKAGVTGGCACTGAPQPPAQPQAPPTLQPPQSARQTALPNLVPSLRGTCCHGAASACTPCIVLPGTAPGKPWAHTVHHSTLRTSWLSTWRSRWRWSTRGLSTGTRGRKRSTLLRARARLAVPPALSVGDGVPLSSAQQCGKGHLCHPCIGICCNAALLAHWTC